MTESRRTEEPTYHKKKEGQLDWSYLGHELPTEPHYCRKDSRNN